MRFFEAGGRICKALSVIKNRGGAHEDTIREFRMGPGGVSVGKPLTEFEAILTGTPRYVGGTGPLLRGWNDEGRPARRTTPGGARPGSGPASSAPPPGAAARAA